MLVCPIAATRAHEGPAVDRRVRAGTVSTAWCRIESAARWRGPARVTRKSSAMWRRSMVARIMPTITIQIMLNTSTSSAPVSTTPST